MNSPTYGNRTPAGKRRRDLRRRLSGGPILVVPGAFNAACARLVERHGFKAVYVSGAATSAGALGLPDIGLMTLDEAAGQAECIAAAVDIPAIADADTGFGEGVNVPRAVRRFESRGLAAIHIEDQVLPKRCGHLPGKELVPRALLVDKIRRAVAARTDRDFLIIARSDARAVNGLRDMLARLEACVAAGADAVFPEALLTLKEYEKVARALEVPVIANMTEFGRTPLFTTREFAEAGCRAVLFPVSLLRVALGAADRALAVLRREGGQAQLLPEMLDRQSLYRLLGYDPARPS